MRKQMHLFSTRQKFITDTFDKFCISRDHSIMEQEGIWLVAFTLNRLRHFQDELELYPCDGGSGCPSDHLEGTSPAERE